MIKKTLLLNAEEGLHARPASLLAKASMKFKSDITMYREAQTNKVYQPKSILSIMSFGASSGEKITFTVSGEDEKEAMSKIESLFSTNFQGQV